MLAWGVVETIIDTVPRERRLELALWRLVGACEARGADDTEAYRRALALLHDGVQVIYNDAEWTPVSRLPEQQPGEESSRCVLAWDGEVRWEAFVVYNDDEPPHWVIAHGGSISHGPITHWCDCLPRTP